MYSNLLQVLMLFFTILAYKMPRVCYCTLPLVGRLVGYNFLARKTSRVSGISETVVCTVKYCTVDSIANAKLSILVRPMSHV